MPTNTPTLSTVITTPGNSLAYSSHLPDNCFPDNRCFLTQTKVGRYLVPDRRCQNGVPVGWRGGFHFGVRFDYSAAAFQRQMEDSLQRTGLGYIDSIVIHDLEPTPRLGTQEEKTEHALADVKVLASSGWGYLVAQRDRGHLKAFGAGLNSNEDGEDEALKRAWNKKYVRALVELHQTQGKIDFLLLANMWSLLNFEAYEDGILQVCEEHGIKIIVGGPYSSGILATGADPTNGSVPYYNYGHASDAVRARCRRIEKICQQFGVPLIAAALQFPLLCSSVVSVIPGGKNEWEVCSNVDNMNVQIPNELWHALKQHKLLPAGLVLPGEESC